MTLHKYHAHSYGIYWWHYCNVITNGYNFDYRLDFNATLNLNNAKTAKPNINLYGMFEIIKELLLDMT